MPDESAEAGRLVVGIEAEHLHGARVPRSQSLEDLHRGGLAGAVGPEDAEDLAAADVEVQAVQHLPLAVRLAQAAHGEDALEPPVCLGMDGECLGHAPSLVTATPVHIRPRCRLVLLPRDEVQCSPGATTPWSKA